VSLLPRAALASSLSIAIDLVAPAARAGNEAAAEALFAEAKRLVAKKNYAEACPKFAESNRLDRGAGTLIHLADCYEKNKQAASAWATYTEAASAAQALGRSDWEKLARKRASALEPTLATIVVRVDEPAPELEVTRDGEPMAEASWGVPIPVDAGSHALEARAPGREPFTTEVTVAKDGQKVEVVIPPLMARATAAASSPAPVVADGGGAYEPAPDRAPPSEAQRTLGFVVGGVGVAALAGGAITGLMAISKNDTSQTECPNDGACGSRAAVDANESARTFATISTIAFGAGAALVLAGTVLVLTAPDARKEARAIRIVPRADARSAGVGIMGVF
jgi:hypothetical protein